MECPSCQYSITSLASPQESCPQCGQVILRLYQCREPGCGQIQEAAQRCRQCQRVLTGPMSGQWLPWNDSILMIREKIGGGGMGDVYLAWEQHPDRGLRQVAIKSNREIGDQERYERFKREVQLLKQIQHPNCVRTFGYGEQEDQGILQGQFMVMEFLSGHTLSQVLHTERPLPPLPIQAPFKGYGETEMAPLPLPLSVALVLFLYEQLASALSAIHQQGIIHRDLKPDNVMIVPHQAGQWQIKLFDFGLAKATQEEGFSTSGVVLGTMWYMSPEQARGEMVDQRSDIFSLGVILYELITHRKPYKADSLYSLFEAHQKGPAPISQLLPQPLPRILEKSLCFAPAMRFQDLDECLSLIQMTRLQPPEMDSFKPALTASASNGKPPPLPFAPPPLSLPKWVLWTLACFVLLTAGASAFLYSQAQQHLPEINHRLAVPDESKGLSLDAGTPPRSLIASLPDQAPTTPQAPPEKSARVAPKRLRRRGDRRAGPFFKRPKRARKRPRHRDQARRKIMLHLTTQPACQTLKVTQLPSSTKAQAHTTTLPAPLLSGKAWQQPHTRELSLLSGKYTLTCTTPTLRFKRSFSLTLRRHPIKLHVRRIWTHIKILFFPRPWAFPFVDSFRLPKCQTGCRVRLWSGTSQIILKRFAQGTKKLVTLHRTTLTLTPSLLQKPEDERTFEIRWNKK